MKKNRNNFLFPSNTDTIPNFDHHPISKPSESAKRAFRRPAYHVIKKGSERNHDQR